MLKKNCEPLEAKSKLFGTVNDCLPSGGRGRVDENKLCVWALQFLKNDGTKTVLYSAQLNTERYLPLQEGSMLVDDEGQMTRE